MNFHQRLISACVVFRTALFTKQLVIIGLQKQYLKNTSKDFTVYKVLKERNIANLGVPSKQERFPTRTPPSLASLRTLRSYLPPGRGNPREPHRFRSPTRFKVSRAREPFCPKMVPYGTLFSQSVYIYTLSIKVSQNSRVYSMVEEDVFFKVIDLLFVWHFVFHFKN